MKIKSSNCDCIKTMAEESNEKCHKVTLFYGEKKKFDERKFRFLDIKNNGENKKKCFNLIYCNMEAC